MGEVKHTPGPWEYVAGTQHHGPYVSSSLGGDICDCYCMSNPAAASVLNGGTSYPVNHQGENADANARLIAAAPDMLAALRLAETAMAKASDLIELASHGAIARGLDGYLLTVRAAIAAAEGH